MTFRFNPRAHLIVVPARLYRGGRVEVLRLALDTGATRTLISSSVAISLGYEPSRARDRARILTGSGALSVPMLEIEKIEALGKEATDARILCHTLPSQTAIDGVLGLDFLRGGRLTIDFRAGLLSLD